MPYALDFSDDVKLFFRSYSGLSRQGRIKLFANLDSSLRENGDALRSDHSLRLSDNSSRFMWGLLLRDGGRLHYVRFVVDDSTAGYGVLRVEFVDIATGGAP